MPVRSKRNTSRRSSSEDSNFYDAIHKGKMTKLVAPNSKTYALSKNITNYGLPNNDDEKNNN